MGSGAYSDPLLIVAAEVPSKPAAPVTSIENVNVRISWMKPYENSSPITAYELYIQNSSESFVLESRHC
jgi:hypothetical protein